MYQNVETRIQAPVACPSVRLTLYEIQRGRMKEMRKFPNDQLQRYLLRGNKRVDGWLYQVDAQLVRAVGDIQTRNNISGSVGEIGVWKGRLFILLYLLLHENEKAFSIDIFDLNHLSKDRPNPKSNPALNQLLEIFLENVRTHAGAIDDLHTFRDASDNVVAADILSKVGNVRLFSIDGGHTKELVINDLELANSTLCEQGVVIFDDCFKPEWPGVMNGLHEFLYKKTSDIVPFAISRNKVFLCRSLAAEMYRESLKTMGSQYFNKETIFFDSPVGFYSNSWEHKTKNKGLPRKIHKILRQFWPYRELLMR